MGRKTTTVPAPSRSELRFSEEVSLEFAAVRDHVLDITGGAVTAVQPADPDSESPNLRWQITITPSGDDAVNIVLPPTTDCTDAGAVCTDNGKMLSTRLELVIPGPSSEQSSEENSAATGLPAITGTAQVGETLTADTSSIVDADGLDNAAFSYQWLADDADIPGATESTYTLAAGDEGKAIKVRVSFTDDGGNDEALTSSATAAVETGPASHNRPHGLQAAAGTDAITLTWQDPDTHKSYGYYQILRHRPELGEANPLIYVEYASTTDRTFIDNDVEPGVLYVYAVKAMKDPFGYMGPASAPAEVRMPAVRGANSPATGLPAITGTAQVGETLTADTSSIDDADGLDNAAFSYQWLADDADISGATESTYTLVAGDEGKAIKVRVSFTDDAGNAESLTSVATGAVAAAAAQANNAATGLPGISGTPQVGETLTADTSPIDDADGLTSATFEYQWIAGGSDIGGATGSSHTLTAAEQGQAIQVRVTFTDDADNEETLTSAATAEVTAAPAPLTASRPDSRFQSARHNGADDRPQVIVAFSMAVASFEKTTPSLSLTGAAVSSVRQHEEDGLKNAWIFFLDPDGDDDIVFSLVTGRPCDSGGICTEDGGMLSEGVQITLPGPEAEEDGDDQQTPQSPPAKPTNLTATVNADGHIVLSWTAPDDDSITGYQVLRRRPGEGESALLVYVADTQSTATTFTDTGVTAGVKHVYRVKAINAAGLSGWSNYVNPTP